jgi:hypothetical protein
LAIRRAKSTKGRKAGVSRFLSEAGRILVSLTASRCLALNAPRHPVLAMRRASVTESMTPSDFGAASLFRCSMNTLLLELRLNPLEGMSRSEIVEHAIIRLARRRDNDKT